MWLGPTYRGEGGEEEAKVDEAAFRFGVQVLNLQTTLQTGKIRESQDVIARILNLLKPQPFTKDLYDRYAAITAALDTKDKRPAREFLPEASGSPRSPGMSSTPTSLDLGQWVEAGRLSAMSGVPDFFQQAANRRFLRRLLWNDKLGLHEVKLDPATRASLDRVSDIISKSDLGRSDYDAIQREVRGPSSSTTRCNRSPPFPTEAASRRLGRAAVLFSASNPVFYPWFSISDH